MSTTPEKYVSIEYDKWNSFYKPLEDKYQKLQNELISERKNKKITLYLSSERMSFSSGGIREIGWFTIEDNKFYINDDSVRTLISRTVTEYLNRGRKYDGYLIGSEEMMEFIKIYEKTFKKSQISRQNLLNELKKIPWLFRWFFKKKIK